MEWKATREAPLPLVWEMETGDPDDFLTLLLLLGHPRVDLQAVLLTPGVPEQVGLVRRALEWFEVDIPVGVHRPDPPKRCVSRWHWDAFGKVPPSEDAAPGVEILADLAGPHLTVLTGAPPKNLGAALERNRKATEPFLLGRWVAQGGFAGHGVVPESWQLEKFRGWETCPSFNLNGAPQVVLAALEDGQIQERRFVSKNVCHGVVYDHDLHEQVASRREQSLALSWIWKGMEHYLKRKPEGKKFHDPLAACCAIEPGLATWAEVELYREKGQWGSRLAPGSGTWIILQADMERFIRVLLEV